MLHLRRYMRIVWYVYVPRYLIRQGAGYRLAHGLTSRLCLDGAQRTTARKDTSSLRDWLTRQLYRLAGRRQTHDQHVGCLAAVVVIVVGLFSPRDYSVGRRSIRPDQQNRAVPPSPVQRKYRPGLDRNQPPSNASDGPTRSGYPTTQQKSPGLHWDLA